MPDSEADLEPARTAGTLARFQSLALVCVLIALSGSFVLWLSQAALDHSARALTLTQEAAAAPLEWSPGANPARGGYFSPHKEGLEVSSLAAGGYLARAGVRPGDVIQSVIEGSVDALDVVHPVGSPQELDAVLRRLGRGHRSLRVLRGGQSQKIYLPKSLYSTAGGGARKVPVTRRAPR